MQKTKVLFICMHNSARSQMAEAFLNAIAGDRFESHSAGLLAGELNPFAVRVMAEVGIDISHHKSKDVQHYLNTEKKSFDYCITVCDHASFSARCPVYPGRNIRIHWGIPDPSALVGSEEEKLAGTRAIRDEIKAKMEEWIGTLP
ncbi:arsenate reductase ArsC [Geomesophilobacter sediminis]|uniref:Arsenate reductase ArsC n=1 Tax=Geomesophilobacter sediminis TaxID=2798584 RepID=A0A8J7JKY1_9BACT|nr:arsenate reductase ArsC [Geomesophilobacter sediminis]MBJ6724295.1 arsenate reductase ArsC [Geomesophilobacter sediminis]